MKLGKLLGRRAGYGGGGWCKPDRVSANQGLRVKQKRSTDRNKPESPGAKDTEVDHPQQLETELRRRTSVSLRPPPLKLTGMGGPIPFL